MLMADSACREITGLTNTLASASAASESAARYMDLKCSPPGLTDRKTITKRYALMLKLKK
jgi:hypothetical protein